MPTYLLVCSECGHRADVVRSVSERNLPGRCPECHGHMRRRFAVGQLAFRRSWDTHFNATTGTVVSNNRQFDDDLKRKGEAMSEKLGHEHSYVRVTDPAQAGIDLNRAAEERRRTEAYVAAHPNG